MLKALALALIRGYQTHISPRKGFSCAYRVHAGGVGCSGFGKHAIQKHGVFTGLILLRRRMAKCAWHAHEKASAPLRSRNLAMRGQGGFVDCDCPGCDMPDCDLPHCDVGDWVGGLGTCVDVEDACSCGDGSSRKAGHERESARLSAAAERRREKRAAKEGARPTKPADHKAKQKHEAARDDAFPDEGRDSDD